MGAYEPKFLYNDVVTGTASATITGGQVLIVSGNGTVGPAGAAGPAVVGVAAFDAASGERVSYFPRGKVHVSTAAGAITAAARVDAGAAGTVASASAAVTNIGIALTTAADTALVEWMEI
ncbi:capsid cement protein [Paractinoplanes maris]|uniref:capsid cement protein n=1 Tax=Paractinoplanes maris TaxID=1734446 RepID=UPI00202127D2|nr:capsid cement protein [Actinoplanes maris]